ncbi:anti-sigma B factor antagonist [Kineosphaera limosa]|uniref:Anti-sigma factor antagonist n=1 Tax=Kineosphaera limosa NBRC 100340 TaxID=1184609 RepID=K6WUF2_9MICO|nr:STAS domain-containing protein [Kineosphaera limosa]NYE01646.1 anti-sigma B factor antagonist [Kineosphaera limosa]GAB97461.1 putative antagonist protein [Kineosphaera limosa NBRC 100340]
MELLLSCTNEGPVTIVDVQGDIDALSAPALQERLEMYVAAGQRHLVLDLSGVPFMDSTGLGVLVGVLRLARAHGGSMRLVAPSERVLRIMAITGLDEIFETAPSRDDAVSATRSQDSRTLDD